MQPIAGPPFNDIHLWLNTEALSAADADAWQTFATQGLQAAGFAVVLHTNQPHPFGPHEAFAAACSSTALTRKLLHNIQHWVLTPSKAPGEVDAWLYSVLAACGLAQRLQLRASRRACTLVSSVFNADEYLSGFLLNASDLHGYEDTENLLIRPGSTGSEHAALLRHACRHDGAVYINLPSDPGLYNLWNLGCRLASGRYVSNANVDDRRAPDQLVHLQEQLNMRATASVASTALRVSRQKNLAWADSSHCKVWFGEIGNKLLDGADLFAQRNGQWVSRNAPHCMPLWRRSLHGWAGEFNQRRYGASADWAMWLKAASGGARFAVSPEAKGLYLRDESTFWRRENAIGAVQRHEAHVLADFGWLADASAPTAHETESLSAVTLLAMERLRMGEVLDALASLLCAWQERLPSELRLAHMAVAQLGRVYLGVQSLPSLLQAQAALYAADRDTGLWNALVDVAQACDAPQGHRAWRWLEWARMDWCETQGKGKGWVLLAWLAARQGQADREAQLLRACHAAGPVAFWSDVQQAYRFGKPLAGLSAIVGDATPQPLGQDAAHLHLKFFPDFRASNAYQTLLYAPWQAAGAQVAAASNWTDFLQQSPSGTAGQVLHLHWLSLMFSRGLSPENLQAHARGLVANLSLRKAEGAEIHWTVHNAVSHASSAPELELEVQRDICLLANKVWVHHPMAAHLLGWMPKQTNLALQEHGSYPLPDGAASNKAQAREALGISQDALLLTQTGMVKPYKGLHHWLPHLLAMLEEAPSMVLLLAGRISCDATLEFLHAHRHPRLVVMNRVLDKTTLHHCMVAEDVGFLSYDRVLTSGTLAHWLRYCINQPDALQRMTAHATKTGGTLRWGGPKTIHEIQGKPS